MSHVATVKIEIKDLDALDAACRELGLELVRDQKTHRYYSGNQAPCEHAIRIPGAADAWEIGIIKAPDGRAGFELAWDSFAGGGGMVEKVGRDCAKLKQQYAKHIAIRHAQRNGYRIQQQARADGSIQLVMSK